MRSPQTLILISGILLVSAAAVPIHQEQLAEQQYKNIQSFKGEKASEVLPAMQFMSAALKVDCSYCHVEDKASDEKDEKKTAREMIAMERDINAKHFGGRTVITCATCHAGHTSPINVPPVTGVEVRPRRSAEVKPADVLAAYGKAFGNKPAAGWHFEGKGNLFGEDVTLNATYATGKFMIIAHGAHGDTRMGFDGAASWFAPPGGPASVLPAEVIQSFARWNMLYLGPSSLPVLTNPVGGTAKIGDVDMQIVSGAIAGEKGRATFYFDKKTGLLARSVFTSPTILGSNVEINDYSDYRRVAGVELPMKVINHTGDRDATRLYSSAKADDKVDPAIFSVPAK